MKRCNKCFEEKKESEFSLYKRSRDGLFSYCKTCNSNLQRARYKKLTQAERYERNKQGRGSKKAQDRSHEKQMSRYRSDPEYREKIKLGNAARYHGLTVDEYTERRQKPCEICGDYIEPGRKGGGMHIDHDHKTDILRGTLCEQCNRGLGMFKDSTERLRAAALYLEKYLV